MVGHVLLAAGRLDTGQLEAQGVQACPSTTHIWPVTFKASNSTSEDDAEMLIVLYAPSREVQSKLLDGSNATAACTTLAIGTRSIDDEMAWCPTAQAGVAAAPLDDLGERWRHVLCRQEEGANRPTWCGEANVASGSWAGGSSSSWAADAAADVSLCGLLMVVAGLGVAFTTLLTMLWCGCCLWSLMGGADEDDDDGAAPHQWPPLRHDVEHYM